MYNLTKPQRLIYETERYAGGSIATICGSILFYGKDNEEHLKNSINELFRINDALRIRITETNGEVKQYIKDYEEKDVEVLHFEDETDFIVYADNLAKEPMNMYGDLCEIKAVVLKDKYGILTKAHHIISDAWTFSLIGTQISQILSGNTPETHSYLDYIDSEQAYFNSNRFEKDKKYWNEIFLKCDGPILINEGQVKDYTSSRKTFVIGTEEKKIISDYAKENNASMYGVLMTAISVYINRIKNNEEKFYVGTAVLNRTGVKEKNTMGMYINTLPVLIELNNELSFADNMHSITKSSMSVFRHQRYNYSDILRDIRQNHSFDGKLYDVIFSYQNAQVVNCDKQFESMWHHQGMQNESLQIHIDDRDNEGILKVHYDYQIEKFSEKQIEKMHEHIFNLLFSAIQNRLAIISKLNFLSKTEYDKIVYSFNDTKVTYPRDKCVHTLFEEQVLKTPDKVAVIAADRTLTYKELNEEANKIAHSLIEKGVKPNDIVALVLSRNSNLITSMLGVLKAGAAYMPIVTDYPQERIDYMVQDVGAKIVLTDDNVFSFTKSKFIFNPNIKVCSDNSFCVLHTSGSTGMPKCVALKHKNMVNFMFGNEYLLKGIENVIAINTITFDVFEMDTIFPLCFGTTCVLASENQQYIQTQFEEMMYKYQNCLFWATPTKMQNYINNSQNKDFVKNISCYIVGGEVVTSKFIENVRMYNKNISTYTVYGPTETLIYSSLQNVSLYDDITIGKPIANTQIYILDKFNNPVPVGITGELCIAGDGVGAGYLNRPELTAEKFVDNPFGDGKMYKTGDLAYWREDGNIVYVGRNDFQVKIRGLRIELGEIENAICMHKNISQAVVVVRKDDNSRQLICAFYTEKEHTDIAEIKKNISDKLPKYMMPHIFTVLDEMPLTSSGKISRKVLAEVDLNNINSSVEYIAPTTENEIILCNAISGILNIEKVSIKDNFFDLGGDSLKAIELIAELENSGVKTTVKTIFDCETVEDIANALTEHAISTEIKSVGSIAPISQAQLRVYTAQTMQGASTGYNVPYAFKVKKLDLNKLQYAIDKMLERHDILRTHFESKDGKIVQIVDDVDLIIEKMDTDDILAFIRPFDLSKAPLMRVGFYKNTVMIDMHHIITDGTSMPIFIKELNEFYCGKELQDDTIQYRNVINNANYSKSEEYWLSVFDEVPVLEINTDFPRGTKQTFNGNAIYDTIDINLHNEITRKSKELNTTPFVFYMAGFNILLSKFSGNEDIVVGMPTSGRNSKNINSIGMFVNTIAMRNKPIGTLSVSEFMENVKENSINALEYQDYSYNLLVKKLGIESQNRNPLFDVMFAYQSEEMTDIVFGDAKAEILPIPITTSKYDFTFNVMPRDNDVVIMAEYCTDLYKNKTITRFVKAYKQILKSMLDEKQYIYDISAISDDEFNKIIYKFNDTKVDYPRDKCVHTLFEEQVVKTPDKVAVIATDRTLTYKELNEEANKIAHSLIEKGIKQGDIVAFMLPRKSVLLSVMFGILKSGAAYMPIDPDYPQERIDYMISDSNAKICITEEDINNLIDNLNINNPCVEMTSNDLCYCIYTSGSTGEPKAVSISHKSVSNFCYYNAKNYFVKKIVENCTSVIAMNSITFDIVLQEIHLPLLNGLNIILTDSEFLINSNCGYMFDFENSIALITTPVKMQLLFNNNEFNKNKHKIKVVMVGADILTKQLVQQINTSMDAIILNGYGPTETTCGVSYGEIIRGI